MVSLESFKPGLQELLGRSDAPALVTEVAWLTAYATASSQKHLEPGDILQPLLALLPTAVHRVTMFVTFSSSCKTGPSFTNVHAASAQTLIQAVTMSESSVL